MSVRFGSLTGSETESSEAATISMAKVAKELGVPAAIIGKMVVTPPSELVWLTPQDLQLMGVTMMGRPSQTENSPVASLQQTPPDAPVSLVPPGASATASQPPITVPTWGELLNKAVNRSASQNNGKPLFDRVCQPEQKICITAVTYLDNAGKVAFLRTVEDMNGKIVAREVCTLNDFKDVRTCLNWDNGTLHRDMKNSNGDWSKVADE